MKPGVEILFGQLSVQAGDTVTIVTDERIDPRVGEMLFAQALALGADADLSRVRARHTNGENFAAPVVAAIRASDIAILATSWSASHSAGVIAATEAGVRVLSMPGVNYEMFGAGAMTADYGEVERLTVRWGELFARGRQVRVTTKAGTDLVADLGGPRRSPFLDTGMMSVAGGLGNMPAGEVAFAPIEGSCSGRIVADIMLSTSAGNLREPVEIEIVDGAVSAVRGGPAGEQFEHELVRHGPSARMVAEIAVGTNPAARTVGIVIEDEKQLGTAHVGFGHSVGIGGENASTIHADAIMAAATVSIDGVDLLRDGEVVEQALQRESLDSFHPAGGSFTLARLATREMSGRLEVAWVDASGEARWAQVGDDHAAAEALLALHTGMLSAGTGTRDAQVLGLLAHYGVVAPAARA
ncbi:aminopeptidase [Phytohabitans sp. ZYX-F-186]|uniref:Aminopeptidase n=1 Tax=Phytohabitans maris TaxID=3071409 RepID=A0ABU0ZIA5_9ACTN|nr:aminopeptidase [Phytohabitans sp. ZYX-F-186]MDQ7906261.1 aminopeptidase [Phytohabitans sp. ZYX-F-186]